MTRMSLTAKLHPAVTALLVIDLQNDFCSPAGLMASMGKDVSGMDTLIEQIKALASACDQAGIPVFYMQQRYDRTKLTALQKEQYDLDGKMVVCDIQGEGHKFYKINPLPTECFRNIPTMPFLIRGSSKS
ncbi:MAG TPA: cysteine hydrolase family protein [Candidatus Saccharimonadales bacterium]